MSKQFSDLKDFVNEKVDTVLSKLEYHERNDDQRFANIDNKFTDVRNEIWMLRLDNAKNPTNQSRDIRRETRSPDTSGTGPGVFHRTDTPPAPIG